MSLFLACTWNFRTAKFFVAAFVQEGVLTILNPLDCEFYKVASKFYEIVVLLKVVAIRVLGGLLGLRRDGRVIAHVMTNNYRSLHFFRLTM